MRAKIASGAASIPLCIPLRHSRILVLTISPSFVFTCLFPECLSYVNMNSKRKEIHKSRSH